MQIWHVPVTTGTCRAVPVTTSVTNGPFWPRITPAGASDLQRHRLDLVGVAGFEPTTSSSRTKRATKLRHTPWSVVSLRVGAQADQNGPDLTVKGPAGQLSAVRVSSVASGGQAKRTGA